MIQRARIRNRCFALEASRHATVMYAFTRLFSGVCDGANILQQHQQRPPA